MQLVPFEPAMATVVSSWARSPREVSQWCSRTEAPVPPAVVASWSEAADVEAFVLVDEGETVAYGELWIDDSESEVELARLIVAPERRGLGPGRHLVSALADIGTKRHPQVIMRVHPDNVAAQRCYAGAAFARVAADVETEWNRGQPTAYNWMVYRPASVETV